MRKNLVPLVLLSLLVFLYTQVTWGQGTTGTISGTVKDSSGAVLPGATVAIVNEETDLSRSIPTDGAGRYTAPSLPLGHYRVTARQEGFQSEVRQGIELTVGREAVVSFELQVGSVSQQIEVAGEAPLVESTSSTVGALVDDRTIRELPLNGRSYDQLAVLQPGVVALGAGAGVGSTTFDYGSSKRFSVAGSRSFSNSFLLDGTDINDHANATPGGAAGTNLGVEGIREFKILTNTYTAEYGRASGGIISAVTQSGTNGLHGSLLEFHRNSVLDARNFFNPGGVPPFRRNQFGGSAGGPIQKDKTFFFGAYEGLRQGLGTSMIAFVPSVAARQGILPTGQVVPVSPLIKPFLDLYPIPNGRDFGDGTAENIISPTVATNENYAMGRVDRRIGDKNSMFGRYSFDSDSVVNPSVFNLPNFEALTQSRRQYSTVQLTSIFSPALLNDAHFAYNRTFQSSDSLPTTSLGPEFSFIPGQTFGVIQTGSISQIGTGRSLASLGTTNGTPRVWNYNLFEWADTLTYIRGRHSLKTGINFKRIRDNASENTSVRGAYTFASFNDMLAAKPLNFEAVPPGQNAYRGYRQNIYGAFAQDDFRWTSRLTLNLGLRWEATSDPVEVNGMSSNLLQPVDPKYTLQDSFFTVSKKNFEPRVGLAWQVNSSGMTVLRAGFGIFHDHLLPSAYSSKVSKNPPFYNLMDAPNAKFPDGYKDLLVTALPAPYRIAPFVKEAAKIQYNLNVQQQFWKEMVVEAAYIGSESSHLSGWRAYNYAIAQIVNGQPFFPVGAARRNPNFGHIRNLTTDLNSNYNALQFTVKRRSPTGLQFQAFYTYSKSVDMKSSYEAGDSNQEPATSLDPLNPGRDRALSYFDARHNFVFTASYPFPFHPSQKAAAVVLGGWRADTIGTFSSGRPFTVQVGFNNSRNGDGSSPDRPNLVPGRSNNPVLGGADQYYDPSAFSLPAAGTYGNLGRNTVIGPGTATVDLALEKKFAVTEAVHAQFRAEVFNIINHANFGLPSVAVFTASRAASRSAGRITDTTTSSRQIQLGLKFVF